MATASSSSCGSAVSCTPVNNENTKTVHEKVSENVERTHNTRGNKPKISPEQKREEVSRIRRSDYWYGIIPFRSSCNQIFKFFGSIKRGCHYLVVSVTSTHRHLLVMYFLRLKKTRKRLRRLRQRNRRSPLTAPPQFLPVSTLPRIIEL